MKIKRLRKNALYMFAYGCSKGKFKKVVRASPDNSVKRIPARQLAKLIKDAMHMLHNPLHVDSRGRRYYIN